jgi:tetratricopeptide (TPR) repeat protein
MPRSVLHSACLFAVLLPGAFAGRSADQNAAIGAAAATMQRGDFASAEKILRAEIQAHAEDPWALSLLGVALDNQRKFPEADEFHRRAVAKSPRSAEILNNYGTHLWSAGQYDKAETFFASALAAAPAYFTALYNLGVMATYTGHYERAREALETALGQQPRNVDVLYRLACVEEASKVWETAVLHLAQAAKLDPGRADVQKLLALTTTELGALDDAAAAWDRYLKLEPNDEIARRERAYTLAKMGKLQQGIAELERFVARHPDDPVGHYELGQAERSLDVTQALEHMDKALALNPNYAPARAARGSLYYQEGKPDSAVKDLELVASLQPDDAANLDRLGQTYQALERTADAVRVLRKAAELAPEDSKTLLHLGRALADAGQTEESKVVMDRFRQLGPEKKQSVPAGLVEYLSLTPEQRRAEYRTRVEKAVGENPDDPAAQVEYLKLMLEDGKADEVAIVAGRIASMKSAGMKPGAAVLAEAGHALLLAGYYALSRGLLEQAAAAGAAGGDVTLDLALATFHATGAAPDAAAIEKALRASPNRPDLYLRETAFLVQQGRAEEALRAIEDAARRLPENREILLMKATTLDYSGQTEGAGQLLKEIQRRWPEWSAAWVAHGILLDTHGHYEEARQALETAVSLGARSAETYFYLADCTLRAGAGRRDAAEAFIGEALKLSRDDPWIAFLAGRIAFERGQYQLAADRQRAVIRQRPQWTEAHNSLAQTWRALGRKQEADAELAQVLKMQQAASNAPDSGRSDDTPPYLSSPYLSSLYQGSLLKGKAARDF